MEKETQNEIYSWASFCHFSALLGFLLWIPHYRLWLPVGHILGPLAAWLWQRRKSEFINLAGKESLNFQIMITLYGIAAYLIFSTTSMLSFIIIALVVSDIIMISIAGVRSSQGEYYRYPFLWLRILR